LQNVQKEPWLIKFSSNGRIPVIIDHDKQPGGYVVMETLEIPNYLTRKYDLEYKFSFEDEMIDVLGSCGLRGSLVV